MKYLIKTFMFVENTILPLLFLWMNMRHVFFLVAYFRVFVSLVAKFSEVGHDINSLLAIEAYLTELTVTVFHLMIFYGLLMRKKIQKEPEGLLEIVVPLFSTFFYLLYGFTQYSPQSLRVLLVPHSSLVSAVLLGALVNIIGLSIATVAIYNLRFSFSIYAEVRDVVSEGLYRYVRHPIYFGYSLTLFGLLIMDPRLDYLFLTVGALLLGYFRARLEEKKLLLHSEAYRKYARETPFIIPSFKRAF